MLEKNKWMQTKINKRIDDEYQLDNIQKGYNLDLRNMIKKKNIFKIMRE